MSTESSFEVAGVETTFETSETEVFLTVEANFFIKPSPNFGFLVAPTLDYALSRSQEVDGEENEADLSAMGVGLRFGITGLL
jgi:hypothetical protein